MSGSLKERFGRMWDMAGAKTEADAAFEPLARLYGGPGRYYHTLRHVEECLLELDCAKDAAENPLAIELALWYHDAIYDPRRHDNEERSCRFLAETLAPVGIDQRLIDEASGLIYVTKHDSSPTETDKALMADIDLSIFGQPAKRFDEYDSDIWKEYAWMGPIRFTDGRIAVLESFLHRKSGHIYSSDFFRQKYEEKARTNLIRMINILKGDDEDF
jgi:predicted metal-dependent HD superfamily phosphohydrolase